MRAAGAAALAAALALALPGPPGAAAGRSADLLGSAGPAIPPSQQLAHLEAELGVVTRHAQGLADALEQARARDGGLRQAVEDLAEQQDEARARLAARVRQVYMAGAPRLLDAWPELQDPGTAALLQRGRAAGLRVEQQLVDDVSQQSDAARALQANAEHFRAGLQVQAAQVLQAQEQARELLAQAQLVAASTAPAESVVLVQRRRALDVVSASVTASLTPAQTSRGRRAGQQQAPLLTVLETAGAGYPAGFSRSGQVLSGTASWYGPGLVGSPTASGTPYDPEQLTCANKELPLGTVLHVTLGNRAVNCLVNDRGPYVGDRFLDLSRAGSRALGYDGTAEVVAEVLLRR